MKNIPLLIATLIGTLALVFGVAFLFGRSTPPEIVDIATLKQGARHILPPDGQNVASASATISVTPVKTSPAPEASSEASPEAQRKVISIVEFSDMQCPACKAAQPLRASLQSKYPGQIEFIFRHYPLLQLHPNSMLAAQAVEAAGNLGKFWEMHDLLYEKQEEWSDLSHDEAEKKFVEYAESLKIEKDLFTKELNSDTVKTAVQSDINVGDQVKVDYTPTFFVEGKKMQSSDVEKTVSDLLTN